VTTLLTSFGVWKPEEIDPEIRHVNDDYSLLSHWPSEDLASDSDPECTFFNFSIVYKSDLCTHFVIARSSSTPYQAFDRAIRCAAYHKTECVLSPEVGLAIPAAFIVPPTGDTAMFVAPRLMSLPLDKTSTTKHVRVRTPSSYGGARKSTRTVIFNSSVHIEYMDGRTRVIRQETLRNEEAYCIQLLRIAFSDECWHSLD